MDPAAFETLLTPQGQALLAELATADLSESALLKTTAALRTRYPAELVSPALTQARLRLRATAKFGADAARMYFTQTGLEQSTRLSVATHRAHRFAGHLTSTDTQPGRAGPFVEPGGGTGVPARPSDHADDRARAYGRSGPPGEPDGDAGKPAGPSERRDDRSDAYGRSGALGEPDGDAGKPAGPFERGDDRFEVYGPAGVPFGRSERGAVLGAGRVLEVCCGIGADLIARARMGIPGVGVERDPLTVAVAVANLVALGLDGLASVREGDALAQDPRGYAAVFADPGRRAGGRRVFDPRAYEPPLDELLALVRRAPGGCVKVAPGIPYEAIPEGAEAEWVSDGGEVKEAALWLGALAGPQRRRATLLPSGATLVPEEGLGAAPTGPWRRYLYEPDGAVIRAHLVAEVAALVDGVLADPQIAYVTSDVLHDTPFARAYEIEDVLPFSLKRLRAELRRRRVGTVILKKRGSAVDLDRLQRDLKPAGPETMTVVLTRVGTDPVALLCRGA